MYILEDMNFFKSIAQYSHIYLLDYSNTCHKLEKNALELIIAHVLEEILGRLKYHTFVFSHTFQHLKPCYIHISKLLRYFMKTFSLP